MSQYIQSNQPIIIPTVATYTVSEADTGKVHLVSAQAGGCAITLPAPKLGLHFRFKLSALAAGVITIGTGAAGGLGGVALTANSTVPVVAANTTVRFAATATFGDYIDVYCISATKYSVSAGSQVNGGIAVA